MGVLILLGWVVIIIMIPSIINFFTNTDVYMYIITYGVKYQNSVKKINTIVYKTSSKKINIRIKLKDGVYYLMVNKTTILYQSKTEIDIINVKRKKYN